MTLPSMDPAEESAGYGHLGLVQTVLEASEEAETELCGPRAGAIFPLHT